MFKRLKTSKENKERVSILTKRLNLRTENYISRIALAYSLSKEEKLDLKDMRDSLGKEYAKSVLLGDMEDIYIGMICTNYNLYKTDKNIPKYLKLHIDHGLESLYSEIKENPKLDGFDFLINKIEIGLKDIQNE